MIKEYCIIYEERKISWDEVGEWIYITKITSVEVSGTTLHGALNYAINNLGVKNVKEVFELE